METLLINLCQFEARKMFFLKISGDGKVQNFLRELSLSAKSKKL